MKNIQTAIIKSATVLSKVVDKLDKVLEKDTNNELNKLFDDYGLACSHGACQ